MNNIFMVCFLVSYLILFKYIIHVILNYVLLCQLTDCKEINICFTTMACLKCTRWNAMSTGVFQHSFLVFWPTDDDSSLYSYWSVFSRVNATTKKYCIFNRYFLRSIVKAREFNSVVESSDEKYCLVNLWSRKLCLEHI